MSARAVSHPSRSWESSSIRTGESAVARLDARQAVDSAPLRRALRLVALPVAALLLVQVFVPTLLPTVLRRLAAPLGNHPPFTLLTFEIATEPRATP